MNKHETEVLEEVVATAVAIMNLTDDKYITEMAAHIADNLIALGTVVDE